MTEDEDYIVQSGLLEEFESVDRLKKAREAIRSGEPVGEIADTLRHCLTRYEPGRVMLHQDMQATVEILSWVLNQIAVGNLDFLIDSLIPEEGKPR